MLPTGDPEVVDITSPVLMAEALQATQHSLGFVQSNFAEGTGVCGAGGGEKGKKGGQRGGEEEGRGQEQEWKRCCELSTPWALH